MNMWCFYAIWRQLRNNLQHTEPLNLLFFYVFFGWSDLRCEFGPVFFSKVSHVPERSQEDRYTSSCSYWRVFDTDMCNRMSLYLIQRIFLLFLSYPVFRWTLCRNNRQGNMDLLPFERKVRVTFAYVLDDRGRSISSYPLGWHKITNSPVTFSLNFLCFSTSPNENLWIIPHRKCVLILKVQFVDMFDSLW